MSKVTVVIPVYNGEHTILKSIKSLKCQTFQDWICIVVNDGSTDDTKNVLDAINDDRFTVVHFVENKGRPSARQIALEMITTKYMCMLDADDWYYPDKLKMQFKYMEANPEITLMSTAWAIVDKSGNLYSVVSNEEKIKHFIFYKYLDYVHVPHASSIIRMSDVNETKYNLKLKYAQDTDFMRRLLIGKNYVLSNELTYIYNRDQSFSMDKYIKSVNFTIESIYSLPISKFLKMKEYLKLKSKIGIVYLIIKIKGLQYYMDMNGRKPKVEELKEYEHFKKAIFETVS